MLYQGPLGVSAACKPTFFPPVSRLIPYSFTGVIAQGVGRLTEIGTEKGFGLVALQKLFSGKPVACHSPLTVVSTDVAPGSTSTSIYTSFPTLLPLIKCVLMADVVTGLRFTTTMHGSSAEGRIPISLES